jgi:hypothetical protein
MKPAHFDYQAPSTLREANRPARVEPRGVHHRRGAKPDPGSRLPPGDPEPAARSAAAARARQLPSAMTGSSRSRISAHWHYGESTRPRCSPR